MHEFSTVDGFVVVSKSLAKMIKYVANEPSVGLFYIQHHTTSGVPNVLSLKSKIVKKSHETNLQTEDLEDSITMVSSMKEYGVPIAEDMIKDIKESLAIMSKNEHRKGLVHNPSSSFSMRRTSSWGSAAWGRFTDGEKAASFFTDVMKSAKERANGLKWVQLDAKDSRLADSNDTVSNSRKESSLNMLGNEVNDPLVANEAPKGLQDVVPVNGNGSLESENLRLASEDYDYFKANREVKLNEWLGGMGTSDSERL